MSSGLAIDRVLPVATLTRIARGASFARDEPDAPLHRDVCPGPFGEHREAVAKPDQPEDVDEKPDEPRDEAGHLQWPNRGHCRTTADGRHIAVVAVAESSPRLA